MLDYLDVYEVWTTVYLNSRVHSIDPTHEIAVNGLLGLLACLILPCGYYFSGSCKVFFCQAEIKLGPCIFSCFFPVELKQIRFALGTFEWD